MAFWIWLQEHFLHVLILDTWDSFERRVQAWPAGLLLGGLANWLGFFFFLW